MADELPQDAVKMPRHQRYYAIHREEKLLKDKERYNNKPEVIAKREEKERLKAQKESEKKAKKEAEKALKQQEKEKVRQEKLTLALATRQKNKKEVSGGLDVVLGIDCPV
jgi:hypothetical protein